MGVAVWIAAALVGGCVIGYILSIVIAKATGSRVIAETEKMKTDAKKEADQILREARVTAKADVVKLKRNSKRKSAIADANSSPRRNVWRRRRRTSTQRGFPRFQIPHIEKKDTILKT